MRSSHGSSVSGSVSASGEVVGYKELEELKDDEVQNRELHVCIMQEGLDFLTWFINRLHYVRWYFWRYKYDRQAKKHIYRGSIRGRGSREDTHGWVLKHDSIIVKIDNETWIKAEKGGVEPGMDVGGIRVKLVSKNPRAPEEWKDPEDGGPGRYSVRFECIINLGEPGTRLTVGVLMEELLMPTSDCRDIECYNALSANCWQYAYSRAKAVLEWAKENTVDERVKTEVERKLGVLATLERPMPKSILQALGNPHTEDNKGVLEQFLRKLSGTLTGLPENSYLRNWGVRALMKVVRWRLGSTSLSSLEHEVGSQPEDLVEDSRAPSVQNEVQPQDLGKDSRLPEQNGAWAHDLVKDSGLLDQDEQDLEIYPNLGSDSET